MKYINKKPAPDFFLEDVKGLSVWDDYDSAKKRALKKYILDNEQHWNCCYCEKKIAGLGREYAHMEHLFPKGRGLYPHLVFEYFNLLVSCEGNHPKEAGVTERDSCGHFKDNNFDAALFLNPVSVTNTADYFVFDASGVIGASSLDAAKADYTINLLNLNGTNGVLAEARKKAGRFMRISIEKALEDSKKLQQESDEKTLARTILSDDSQEFITFLRYRWKNLA